MNTKTAKVFSVLMVMALSFCLLTGCGETSQSTKTSSTGSTDSTNTEGFEQQEIREMTIQICHGDATGLPYDTLDQVAIAMGKYIEELSGGKMTYEVIGNAQMGAERETVEGLMAGSLQCAVFTNMILGNFVPEYMAFDLPYSVLDYDAAFEILSSDLYLEADAKMLEETGVRILGHGNNLFRNFVGNKEVYEVADLEGLKLRTPENKTYMATFEYLGANPTPMAHTEVLTAMQQGTIDAAEYGCSNILRSGFYTAASNISLTHHIFNPMIVACSDTWLSTLTEAEQEVIIQAGYQAAVDSREYGVYIEGEMFKELEANGVKINEVNDLESFRSTVYPVYELMRDQIGSDFLDRYLEFCGITLD